MFCLIVAAGGRMQDLRLAVRALHATPIVTIVALLSLALGIGANTTIFSLLNSLLLRALPVAEPQRLVVVSSITADNVGWQGQWSYHVWDQIRQRPELFDGAAAYSTTRFNLAAGGEAQFVDGLWANSSFLKTLGVPLMLGRTFTDADDVRGGGPDGAVAVVSYGFWQRHFGGAADAIGRTLTFDTVPFTVRSDAAGFLWPGGRPHVRRHRAARRRAARSRARNVVRPTRGGLVHDPGAIEAWTNA
jgi:putative ABC transport system permease protein